MKKGLAVFGVVFLLFFQLATAEEKCPDSLLHSHAQIAIPSEGLTRVLIHGKYGYTDAENHLVIPAKYDAADDFYDGFASVRENGKWEVINSRGKALHPWALTTVRASHWVGPIELITPNLETHARSIDARFLAYPENRRNETFKDLEALRSDPSSPLLPAKFSGRWGFVDRRISLENPVESLAIFPQYEDAKPFSNDLAAVRQNGKWGYIDDSGKFVIPAVFDQAESFDRNLALVRQGHKLLTIDLSGKTLLSCELKSGHMEELSLHPLLDLQNTADESGIVMGAPEKE